MYSHKAREKDLIYILIAWPKVLHVSNPKCFNKENKQLNGNL